jgi:hypothetical protein
MTQSQQDRAFRERLEKRSIDEGRADVAGSLNRLSAKDGVQKSAGLVLVALRASAQGRKREVGDLNAKHSEFMAKAASEASNRLHPLDRTAASFRPQPSQAPDREGEDPAYGDRYVSPLRAGKVRDEAGSMRGGSRDHWDDQGGRFLGAREFKEKLRLSPEQMRALAIAVTAASRYF